LALAFVCVLSASGLEAKDPAPAAGPTHVVALVLGGGVRASDVLDPTRMPQVAAFAAQGLKADALPTQRPSAWLSLRDLLTGREDEPEAPGRPQTANPTLFEVVRLQPGVPAEAVWLVDAGSTGEPGLQASTHPAYGASLAASVAPPEGALAAPLAAFLEQMGRPLPVPDHVWPLLRRLRDVNRRSVGPFLPESIERGLADAERVERAVLRELDRKATFVKAAQPADEKAVRAALTVLAVHRPRLLVVRVTGAQSAHQSQEAYFAALRQADDAFARLGAAVTADPVLAPRTVLAVLTEGGRNAKPDANGGLGATEESPARRHALALMAGPGVKPGSRPKGAARLADVAPTLARLLGGRFPPGSGRAWEECLR
jgi:hypothetical protein